MNFKPTCYEFAKNFWKKLGYTRKDISVTSCCGDWLVETPNSSKEVHAHCKWCAVVEALMGETNEI